MSITIKELKKLISISAGVERISCLSDDGKNLLTRVPKEVKEFLELEKGNKIRWIVDSNKKISIEIIQSSI
jgi:hypothetical protein